METSEARSQAWSRYWATGAEHSCAGSFSLTGAGALADFWRGTFAGCGPDACIVDLGTGNAGLLKLAWDLLPAGHAARLFGIDLSRPAPGWIDEGVHGDRIRIIGETPMEATGLPAGSVDLLVSQFGIEYAERGRVQAECLRLLDETGRIAFVIHHADSVITHVAREEVEAIAFLLADDGLLASASALLPHMADAKAGQAATSAAFQARDRFNHMLEQGGRMAQTSSSPELLTQAAAGIRQFLSVVERGNLASLQRQLDAYREELRLASTRSAEQVACAMDADQLADFMQPFRDAGMTVAATALRESGQLIGWAVEGGDPASP